MRRLPCLVLTALLALALPAAASDKAKEQRWAEQIVDQLIEGEAVWLEAGTDRFLGILTEAEGTPRGAVILLHGISNCPHTYVRLGAMLHARGHSVVMPRMPQNGHADRNTDALRRLTAEQLASYGDAAVDVAAGLADEVVVCGISAGGSSNTSKPRARIRSCSRLRTVG